MITPINKESLLNLIKSYRDGKVVVYRYIVMPGVKPHWKKYYINPENVHGSTKVMRVVKGHELLPENHPQKHLSPVLTSPEDTINLDSLSPEELQVVQSNIGEEIIETPTKGKSSVLFNSTPPKTIKELDKQIFEFSKEKINTLSTKFITNSRQANLFLQNSLYAKPSKLKSNEWTSKIFRLRKYLDENDIAYYLDDQTKSIIESNSDEVKKKHTKDIKNYLTYLENVLFRMAYLGFNPNNPQRENIPKQFRQSTYKPLLSIEQLSEQSQLNSKNNSERETDLIEFANKLQTIEDIQGCTRLGIIPEDNTARDFLLNKIQPLIAQAVLEDNLTLPEDIKTKIRQEWGESTLVKLASLVNYSNMSNFQKMIHEAISLINGNTNSSINNKLGFNLRLIEDSFKPLEHFQLGILTNPQSIINNVSNNPYSPINIINTLNEAYSLQSTDNYINSTNESGDYTGYNNDYLTNLGYTGNNPDEYKKRNLLQDGIIRLLSKITEQEPQLKDKCTDITENYKNLMSLVQNNPQLLKVLLSQSNWKTLDLSSINDLQLQKNVKQFKDALESEKVTKYKKTLSSLKKIISKKETLSKDQLYRRLLRDIPYIKEIHELDVEGLSPEQQVFVKSILEKVSELVDTREKILEDYKNSLTLGQFLENTKDDDIYLSSEGDNAESIYSNSNSASDYRGGKELTPIGQARKYVESDRDKHTKEIKDLDKSLSDLYKELERTIQEKKTTEDKGMLDDKNQEKIRLKYLEMKSKRITKLRNKIKALSTYFSEEYKKDNYDNQVNQELDKLINEVDSEISNQDTSTGIDKKDIKLQINNNISKVLTLIPENFLSTTFRRSYDTIGQEDTSNAIDHDYAISDFGIVAPQNASQAQQLVYKVDAISDVVIDKLINAMDEDGKPLFTQKQIIQALQDNDRNDNLSEFYIQDKNGNNLVINFIRENNSIPALDRNGKPLRNKEGYIVYEVTSNPFFIKNKDVLPEFLSSLNQITNLDLSEWKNKSAFYDTEYNHEGHWGKLLLSYTRGKLYNRLGIKPKNTNDATLINAANSAYKQAVQMSQITPEMHSQIQTTAMKLFGLDTNGEVIDNSIQAKTIIANLLMNVIQHRINTNLAQHITTSYQGKRKKDNRCNYYSGTIMSNLPTTSQNLIIPVGYFSNRNRNSFNHNFYRILDYKKERQLQDTALLSRLTQINSENNTTAQGVNNIIQQQINNATIWSEEFLTKLRNLQQDKEGFIYPDLSTYANSPLNNILLSVINNTLSYLPQFTNTKIDRTLFTKKKLSSNLGRVASVSPEELKIARTELVKRANCTIGTLSKKDTYSLNKRGVPNGVWGEILQSLDYEDGDTTPEGTEISKPFYHIPDDNVSSKNSSSYNQRVFLNSPIFQINYDKHNDEYNDNLDLEEDSIPVYHGTSYSNLMSLFSDKHLHNLTFTDKVLGATQFCGNNPEQLTNSSSIKPNKNDIDGLLLVGSALRGKTKDTTIHDANPKTNTGWTLQFNKSGLFLPEYIMDVSSRIVGNNITFNHNKWQDNNNTYDVNGISTKIKWGGENT